MFKATFWKRKPKHVHEWRVRGYGGCGWHAVECVTCGEEEIA